MVLFAFYQVKIIGINGLVRKFKDGCMIQFIKIIKKSDNDICVSLLRGLLMIMS